MTGRHVAFLRNLDLGQRGSPTRAELLRAFDEAGAHDVESFHVNGTVIFTSSSPARTRDRACSRLIRDTDWCDVAPVRSRAWLIGLAGVLEGIVGNAEVSLFDVRREFPQALPWRPDTGRLTVVTADQRHAIAVNDEPRRSFATPTLERLLGVPITSRGSGTVLRLVQRLA
jgi:hypothetical protein